MKPADVKSSTYIDSSEEINDKDLKFKVGNFVRISKYKKLLQKAMLQIGLTKFLRLENLKIMCCGLMLLVIIKAKKFPEHFTKTNYKKQIKNSLELKE